MWIGIKGIDGRGVKVTGRDAVTMGNEVDGPIVRPRLSQSRNHFRQIGFGIRSIHLNPQIA